MEPRYARWERSGPSRIPRPVFLAIVAVVQVGGTYGASRDQPEAADFGVLAVALLLLGPLLLGLLWKRPVVAVYAVLATTILYLGGGYPFGPFVLAPIIALARTTITGHRLAAWIAGGVGVVGALVAHAVSPHPDGVSWANVAGVITWVCIVLVGSQVIRAGNERRLQATAVRAEAERRRASDERLRIAQELHDVLAHDISLINVQAGVGLHLMDTRPEQAREALATIKHASKDALVELRAALDLLRSGDTAPRAPTGGLDDLDGVVARLHTPQLSVALDRVGAVREIPPGVDLAAFRIAQEALTNVVRHSLGATHASVLVDYRDDALIVQVEDDGRGSVPDGTPGGSGIDGMRERARALGGTLDAGPQPSGGFRVRAWLPLEPATQDVAS